MLGDIKAAVLGRWKGMGGVYTSRELLGSKKDWPFSKQAGEAWQFPSCCWPGSKTEGLPWSMAATLSLKGRQRVYKEADV